MLAARVGLLVGLMLGGLRLYGEPPRVVADRPPVVVKARAPRPPTHRRRPATRRPAPALLVTAAARERWTRVAICEEGGWHNAHGPTYFGALGWLQSTWDQFRAPSFPARMNEASITQQIWAAQRFAGYYHLVPDQSGCTGSY